MRYTIIAFLILLIMVKSSAQEQEKKKLDKREYIITGSDITTIKSFELSNKSEFSSFSVIGSWTDNFGNYGKSKCMGIINKNLKNVELYFMCERVDKNGYKVWSLNKRKSGIQETGVGTFEIVDATIPNKKLFIGTECTYAVKYLEETNFYRSKCDISEELASVFEKMGLEK
tara:strand:- start:155 stop:670 length:516 start_codon:yes stop_codon:yes gene_type:complete